MCIYYVFIDSNKFDIKEILNKMNKSLLKVGVIEVLGCSLPDSISGVGKELKVYRIFRDGNFINQMLSSIKHGLVNIYTDVNMSELIGYSNCFIDGESLMIKEINSNNEKEYAAIYDADLIKKSGSFNGIEYDFEVRNPKIYGVYLVDSEDKNHSI